MNTRSTSRSNVRQEDSLNEEAHRSKASSPVPVKRKRGRPPGSKNKKPMNVVLNINISRNDSLDKSREKQPIIFNLGDMITSLVSADGVDKNCTVNICEKSIGENDSKNTSYSVVACGSQIPEESKSGNNKTFSPAATSTQKRNRMRKSYEDVYSDSDTNDDILFHLSDEEKSKRHDGGISSDNSEESVRVDTRKKPNKKKSGKNEETPISKSVDKAPAKKFSLRSWLTQSKNPTSTPIRVNTKSNDLNAVTNKKNNESVLLNVNGNDESDSSELGATNRISEKEGNVLHDHSLNQSYDSAIKNNKNGNESNSRKSAFKKFTKSRFALRSLRNKQPVVKLKKLKDSEIAERTLRRSKRINKKKGTCTEESSSEQDDGSDERTLKSHDKVNNNSGRHSKESNLGRDNVSDEGSLSGDINDNNGGVTNTDIVDSIAVENENNCDVAAGSLPDNLNDSLLNNLDINLTESQKIDTPTKGDGLSLEGHSSLLDAFVQGGVDNETLVDSIVRSVLMTPDDDNNLGNEAESEGISDKLPEELSEKQNNNLETAKEKENEISLGSRDENNCKQNGNHLTSPLLENMKNCIKKTNPKKVGEVIVSKKQEKSSDKCQTVSSSSEYKSLQTKEVSQKKNLSDNGQDVNMLKKSVSNKGGNLGRIIPEDLMNEFSKKLDMISEVTSTQDSEKNLGSDDLGINESQNDVNSSVDKSKDNEEENSTRKDTEETENSIIVNSQKNISGLGDGKINLKKSKNTQKGSNNLENKIQANRSKVSGNTVSNKVMNVKRKPVEKSKKFMDDSEENTESSESEEEEKNKSSEKIKETAKDKISEKVEKRPRAQSERSSSSGSSSSSDSNSDSDCEEKNLKAKNLANKNPKDPKKNQTSPVVSLNDEPEKNKILEEKKNEKDLEDNEKNKADSEEVKNHKTLQETVIEGEPAKNKIPCPPENTEEKVSSEKGETKESDSKSDDDSSNKVSKEAKSKKGADLKNKNEDRQSESDSDSSDISDTENEEDLKKIKTQMTEVGVKRTKEKISRETENSKRKPEKSETVKSSGSESSLSSDSDSESTKKISSEAKSRNEANLKNKNSHRDSSSDSNPDSEEDLKKSETLQKTKICNEPAKSEGSESDSDDTSNSESDENLKKNEVIQKTDINEKVTISKIPNVKENLKQSAAKTSNTSSDSNSDSSSDSDNESTSRKVNNIKNKNSEASGKTIAADLKSKVKNSRRSESDSSSSDTDCEEDSRKNETPKNINSNSFKSQVSYIEKKMKQIAEKNTDSSDSSSSSDESIEFRKNQTDSNKNEEKTGIDSAVNKLLSKFKKNPIPTKEKSIQATQVRIYTSSEDSSKEEKRRKLEKSPVIVKEVIQINESPRNAVSSRKRTIFSSIESIHSLEKGEVFCKTLGDDVKEEEETPSKKIDLVKDPGSSSNSDSDGESVLEIPKLNGFKKVAELSKNRKKESINISENLKPQKVVDNKKMKNSDGLNGNEKSLDVKQTPRRRKLAQKQENKIKNGKDLKEKIKMNGLPKRKKKKNELHDYDLIPVIDLKKLQFEALRKEMLTRAARARAEKKSLNNGISPPKETLKKLVKKEGVKKLAKTKEVEQPPKEEGITTLSEDEKTKESATEEDFKKPAEDVKKLAKTKEVKQPAKKEEADNVADEEETGKSVKEEEMENLIEKKETENSVEEEIIEKSAEAEKSKKLAKKKEAEKQLEKKEISPAKVQTKNKKKIKKADSTMTKIDVDIQPLPTTIAEKLESKKPAVNPAANKIEKRISKKKQKRKATKDFLIDQEVSKPKKLATSDYIPLEVTGPTKFGVTPLNKFKKSTPYNQHPAANFKNQMLYGDRVKRLPSGSLKVIKEKRKFFN